MPDRELVLRDIERHYASREVDEHFLSLYSNIEPRLRRMFASVHERLNEHLEFMNYKAGTNGHYNADDSRRLLELIRDLDMHTKALERAGLSITLAQPYAGALAAAKDFLQPSGGSPIPDHFQLIELERYAPILEVSGTTLDLGGNTRAELRLIGEGAFAHVFRYRDSYYGVDFAVKRAKRGLSERDLARFRQEYDVLSRLNFPYVLRVFRYDADNDSYIMEHCEDTLLSYVQKENSRLAFGTRKRIALQFLFGLNYLHKKGFLHRDLSLNNTLVKRYDLNAVVVKLSDFGLVKTGDSDFTRTGTEMKGTILDPALEAFGDYAVPNEI